MKLTGIFCALILGLAIFGCGGDKGTSPIDPAGAQAEAQLGDQALASGDFEAASQHYEAALQKDPSNPQANIGAAITDIYLLQNDPEVAQLFGYIGGSPAFPIRSSGRESARSRVERLTAFGDTRFQPLSPVRAVGRLTAMGTEDPPLLSDVQRVIRTKVLPRLERAEERLNRAEQNPSWRFLLPPSVTNEPDTIEVDLGEVYAVDAVVNAVQGWLQILVAYNFDTPNGAANPESLLANGTAFGTLHTGGAVYLGAARNNWMRADTQLEAGIAFIDNETDDQSNDVIPRDAVHLPEFLAWKAEFDKLQTSLSAPVAVSVTDCASGEVSVNVQIGRFFTTPITDFKTKLPAHTFDENHEPVLTEPLTFPDPTFNGIFPGMTDAVWRTLICGPPPPAMIARGR